MQPKSTLLRRRSINSVAKLAAAATVGLSACTPAPSPLINNQMGGQTANPLMVNPTQPKTPTAWEISGSSTTKRLLQNTNTENRGAQAPQEKAVDVEAYRRGISKLNQQVTRLARQEAIETYTLKASEIGVNGLLELGNILSLGRAEFLIEPLQQTNSLIIDSAIANIKEDYQAKTGALITALASKGGRDLSNSIASYQGSPQETQKLRAELKALAKKELSYAQQETFERVLDSEFLTQTLTYAAYDIKQVLAGNKIIQTNLDQALGKISTLQSDIDKIEVALGNFIEASNSHMDIQGILVTGIVKQNILADQKLNLLSQMMFSQLSAKQQLVQLEKDQNLLPFSTQERNELIKSLKFRVTAEESLQIISDIGRINANLNILGANEERTLHFSATAIQAALAFSEQTPMGFISGVAALSSLFGGGKKDNSTQMILANQKLILEELQKLRADIESLKMEIREGFDKIREQIYISRDLESHRHHYNQLAACQVVSTTLPAPQNMSLTELQKVISEQQITPHIATCMQNLRQFFTNLKSPLGRQSAMRQISLDAHMKGSLEGLRSSYDSIVGVLKDSDSKELYKDSEYKVENLIDPEAVELYVAALLNNLYWFEIASFDKAGNFTLVSSSNQLDSRPSIQLLNQALNLVKLSLRQQQIWAGIEGGKELYAEYEKLKKEGRLSPQCSTQKSHPLCIALDNPYFARNLLMTILDKEVGTHAYLSTLAIAPNNPHYLNQRLRSPFQFVWVGDKADPLYSGERITDPKVISRYGEGLKVILTVGSQRVLLPAPTAQQLKNKEASTMPGWAQLRHLEAYLIAELTETNMQQFLTPEELKAITLY